MTDPVPVLIVDDQAPFRRAARAVVTATPGFEVVGEAESGEEAVELADAQRCRVRIAGRPIDARRDGTVLRFEAAADVRQPMRYQSVEIACDR